MLKTLLQFTLILSIGASVTACKEKKKAALPPGELTEAQRAELRAKALANYKKGVEKYPDSPYVEQEKARIQALSPPPKK